VVTLESCKLFSVLKPQDLAALRQLAQQKSFAAGHEIFKEGDAGDGLYLLKEGLVEISSVVGQSVRHVFYKIEPGEVFGEMAVLEDKPRSASAIAREASVTDFIPRGPMLELVERSPALAQALLREISSRLREFNRQYLREVLQAERLAVVGRFARSIVHDLKNPLNIIGLTAEIAGMANGTPEARRKAVVDIRHQVERISEMVGEILDFTQGTAPQLLLPPMDYSQFVQQLMTELGPETAAKGAQLELQNAPPSVGLLLNPKRLRRVFFNLVHNAVEAMPDGGKITLRFEARPKEVVTELEDSGRGIAPEIAGQLFQPFATFGKAQGTGLGLSICKRIIEDHHGWIKARNEPGRGAVFSFALPVPSAAGL
jgi:signal transduction histidine kinase